MSSVPSTGNASRMHYSAQGQGGTVKCKGCDVRFTPTRSWQEFHSKRCRTQFHARDDRNANQPSLAERVTALEARLDELERTAITQK